MTKILFLTLFFTYSLTLLANGTEHPQRISLQGTWQFSLDPDSNKSQISVLEDSIQLPGTTDTNRKGFPCTNKQETTHLTRLFSYIGRAWYRRTISIPKTWKKQVITLHLERTKPTTVFIDGKKIGTNNNISTPQVYDLTPFLKPGDHHLTILVDNAHGVPHQLYANSHAYTEDTQTNWNGIIGEIYLQATPHGYVEQKTYPLETLPCFKDFHIQGHHFYANGRMTFLRGKHDACVWPLTAHVAMDKGSWISYLGKLKQYGINHIRFHSWCPPEAAFAAADELGFYLQPELPFWGSFDAKDTVLMSFLHQEGVNILKEYGHHPSFVMMALGNELWGDIDEMKAFVDDFRRINSRILYTFGSNYYLGFKGWHEGMDYFTTCRVGGEAYGEYQTHTRSSFSFADAAEGGIINHFYPATWRTFDEAIKACPVPVISHETAQFQTYPDYNEIKKYTGVLYPYNMEIFRDRLNKAGMLDQAADFHKASGQWSVELYKSDIEMDLRSKEMAGFQPLDLQDYPGQGSAYIGLLDAFMESKGITTPEEFRQWCAPVVPLLVAKKYCFRSDEGFHADIEIANYSETPFANKTLHWQLTSANEILLQGDFPILSDQQGVTKAGTIQEPLPNIIHAMRCDLTLSIPGTEYKNTYPIWVYPSENRLQWLKKKIIITDTLTEAIQGKLQRGAKVLLMPKAGSFKNTVGGLFATDYWNYRMFKTISEKNRRPVSPGTLGILTYPQHPIFQDFPTEMHTNWQWYPILRNSSPMVLDGLEIGYRPIVQVIDNVERNHKLGLIFEFAVGKGKLLFCMSDLEKASEYPEGEQLYLSILKYMLSDDFQPSTKVTLPRLLETLNKESSDNDMKELNNISYH